MSYGQPCRRITTGPSAGPASAYPTFRTPALTCFSVPSDVLVPALTVGRFSLPDCACAEPIMPSWVAARVMAAVPRKPRRLGSILSDMSTTPIEVLTQSQESDSHAFPTCTCCRELREELSDSG